MLRVRARDCLGGKSTASSAESSPTYCGSRGNSLAVDRVRGSQAQVATFDELGISVGTLMSRKGRKTDLVGNQGENLVVNALAKLLEWVARKDHPDDGVDLNVEIPAEENRA